MSKDFSADPDDEIKWFSETASAERDQREYWEGRAKHWEELVKALEVENTVLKEENAQLLARVGVQALSIELLKTEDRGQGFVKNVKALEAREKPNDPPSEQ